MPDAIETGTILIKEGTLLPEALRFESEPYAPGWRLVKNIDGYGLDRKIHEAGWTFFYLAGDIKATVLGREGQKTVRRAVKRILTNLKSEKFNGLEITQVEAKRFLGVPYAGVCAHSRHIQEGMFLVPAKKDFRVRDTAQLPSARVAALGLGIGEKQRQGEVVTKRYVAMISSP